MEHKCLQMRSLACNGLEHGNPQPEILAVPLECQPVSFRCPLDLACELPLVCHLPLVSPQEEPAVAEAAQPPKTLNPQPQTTNQKPQTPNPKPQTPNPKP